MIDTSHQSLKEDIVEFKDEILHEILNLRDDIAVITRYREDIADHQRRIDELEKHVYPSK